jgi:predicted MFS family arabinose efflux permease
LTNHPSGGVIYPIIFHRLQPQIGFGWATRVIGFIELATLAVPLAVMKVRVLPPAKRKLVDWSAFRDVPFLLFSFGGLIGFMGLYVPFFYTQYYSISTDITDANLGFYLLAILNAASVFGRVVPNFIADKVGPLNVLFPCALITGVLTLCLLAIHSVGGIVVFAVLYGFFSGTFVSLPSAVFVKLSPHRGVVGTRIGMGFSVISIGVLIGTPIGGAILGKVPNLHWNDLFVYAGVLTLAGAVFFGLAGIAKSRLSREG